MWIQRLSEVSLIAVLALGTRVTQAAPPPARAELPDDPLAGYREQFKLGMDRYKAGALTEAVGYWEPVYRELGERRGYRLAYDLGVSYQQLGDATRAAERLQGFLAEVETRRTKGEALASIVEREAADARGRIGRLIATKGRIHVDAVGTPQSARLDASEPRLAGFVAWVTPGEHAVTFAEGTPQMETRSVHVDAGEIVEIAPKPSVPPLAAAPAAIVLSPPPALLAPFVTGRETHHPFAWPLIAVSGGVAVAMGLAAWPLEDYAWKLRDRYQRESPVPQTDANNYANARTLAYAAVGGAIGFAAVTAGLAAWYFLGTSDRDVMVTPAAGPERGGASLGVAGRF
jgi:hypothetical protein